MAARATGFALLSSNSVQEAMDFALIAHAVSFVPISLIGFTLFATSPVGRNGWKQLLSSPETPQKPAELG